MSKKYPQDEWQFVDEIEMRGFHVTLWKGERSYEARVKKYYKTQKGEQRSRTLMLKEWEIPQVIEMLQGMQSKIEEQRNATKQERDSNDSD